MSQHTYSDFNESGETIFAQAANVKQRQMNQFWKDWRRNSQRWSGLQGHNSIFHARFTAVTTNIDWLGWVIVNHPSRAKGYTQMTPLQLKRPRSPAALTCSCSFSNISLQNSCHSCVSHWRFFANMHVLAHIWLHPAYPFKEILFVAEVESFWSMAQRRCKSMPTLQSDMS